MTLNSMARLRPDFGCRHPEQNEEAELFLLQGKPIGEPVVQYGPFVMNSTGGNSAGFRGLSTNRIRGWPWPADDPVFPEARDDMPGMQMVASNRSIRSSPSGNACVQIRGFSANQDGVRVPTNFPPQQEEGWTRHQEEAAKPPLMERTGWCCRNSVDHTTPAARLFLIVQPPLLLLRRGADCCNFQSAPAI